MIKRLTLRQVEEATGQGVSNSYLSQLEHDRIRKPSPNILHSLAEVYAISYAVLMEKAGYVTTASGGDQGAKSGGGAALANEDLTSEEEEELLRFLAFLRARGVGKT
jgi:transcriptional regulator with XRE-family HTH domain